MKLIYRGVGYDYAPNQSATNSGLLETPSQRLRTPYVLNYRGTGYRVFPDMEPVKSVPQPIVGLVYRGSAYSLNGWSTGITARSEVSPSALRSKTMTASEVADLHRSNLYHNVQRRLRAAEELGDADLIRLLERELQQIA
jgi:hypothetical protein